MSEFKNIFDCILICSLFGMFCAGGILDRVDSYIFTGALAYSFVKIFLPLYGV